MEISFKGPVMPIDPYSQLAFVEILNIILIANARTTTPICASHTAYWICRSVCLQQRIKRMMREYSTNHQRIWKRQSRYPTER